MDKFGKIIILLKSEKKILKQQSNQYIDTKDNKKLQI